MKNTSGLFTMANEARAFMVGEWHVEADRNMLVGPDGRTNRLPPKTMDVLCLLIERAGQVVSREEILNVVWGASGVGDDSLNNAISSLRSAFRDDRRNPSYIETIPKRGYRLAAVVEPAG